MTKNYIIAINENGEPFIAHASRPSSHSTSSHRYLHKVRVGHGPKDYRYFYSEEEYQKYIEGEKRKRVSYGAQAQKRYDAQIEYAKLRKESNRYVMAAQKARQRGLNTLANKMSKKATDLQKRMDELYEIGYRHLGGNMNDFNYYVFMDDPGL